ncbi:chemotaxis protein MotC [Phyllobacterium bourgognense]|uniref:Chemotaxis protein MotC n=1 Tax=Phyllobacterium bourgognense TaxID=314236 RepID=A0A368YPV7_9HYPH|nr:chemotaxis protein MotC [Phyllobacterium bourgognense]RCW82261.1 chemotaxis protein MotC [Phyllobacterium bourgognense]
MIARQTIRLLLFGLFSLPLTTAQAAMPSPEPYMLVRSMRMLQDQVASGKPEALPMLNRVLGHIAAQLQLAKPEVWSKPANVYAIFIYLLNGGNPQVVRTILASANLGQVDPKLVAGSLAYADGDTLRIIENFQELPPNVPIELVASIYLVTATQLAGIDAATALKRLDYIRLNAPGTLLEEAALRRGLMIAARLGDKDKVRLMARNYLQRFAFSPYSEDFFRQLVDALMVIKHKISNAEIEEMASLAWPGARLPFYLRMARGAIVDGDMGRARFASQQAEALATVLKADDTQARLYLAVSNVGSDKTGEAKTMLSQLPKDRLHGRDVELMEAATTMANKILAQPIPAMDGPQQASAAENSMAAVGAGRAETTPIETLDPMIDATRKKLDAIDALLGKARK